MATISSPGIGSGLDVKNIVSQLVALEQAPLTKLQTDASSMQAKLSAFGQLQSQVANLQDQVSTLANKDTWNALTVTSSGSSVTGTITNASLASPTSFSVDVTQLAQSQATASSAMSADSTPGAGTLNISMGSWNGTTFAQKSGTSTLSVDVSATDTLSTIAGKINQANAGVTATVLNDISGQRLLIQSASTGVANGFRVQTSNLSTGSNLGQLAYDPGAGSTQTTLTQAAKDTAATINGIPVNSSNRTFTNIVPGVNLSVTSTTTTTGPVTVTLAQDTASLKTAIGNMVTSFNALNNALAEMTKYDASTKTAGTLQGDSTAVGLQNALHRLFSGTGPAGTSIKTLSDLGIELQKDGTLSINDSKLSAALTSSTTDVKNFFTAAGATGVDGMAVRIQNFTQGLLNFNGALTTKSQSIQHQIDRNSKDQDTLNTRISTIQTRLTAQYSRLDSQLAQLNSLNAYVAQQVTAWNKSSGG